MSKSSKHGRRRFYFQQTMVIPPDTRLLYYGSATAAPLSPGPVHCVFAPSQLWQSEAHRNRYVGHLFLADAMAQCSNSAEFCTEQTGSHALKQYNIRLLLKIKNSMLIPAHKSQKREMQALLLIFWLGTLCGVVFVNIYNCGRE